MKTEEASPSSGIGAIKTQRHPDVHSMKPDTHAQREAIKARYPAQRQKMQESHPAEDQALQPRDLRQWRETHNIAQHPDDRTSAPTGSREWTWSGETQRHGNSPGCLPSPTLSQEWGHHLSHCNMASQRPGRSSQERMARGKQSCYPPAHAYTWGWRGGDQERKAQEKEA